MGSDQLHHTGLLVADVERAASFYIDALDGRWLVKPTTIAGEPARAVFGGGADTAFRFCFVGFDSGAVELVEFVADPPEFARDPDRALLPHFGLVVDDVLRATDRVEGAGGRRLWEEPVSWGGATVMYAADPDGNPFELFDAPLQSIVEMTIEMFPDSAP
jgi:lactoylglutathione lyase